MKLPGLTQIRDTAHSLIAVLGVVSGGAAVIVSFLAVFGVHVSGMTIIQDTGAVGGLLALGSKGIDSWNAAKLGIFPGNTTGAPAAVNPTPGPAQPPA